MLTKSSQKVARNFNCEFCHYNTCKIYNWNKHILTHKHKMLTNANKSSQKVARKTILHHCNNCGKIYKQTSSLSRHRKICKETDTIEINKDKFEEIQVKAELYEEQKQDMQQFQAQFSEQE